MANVTPQQLGEALTDYDSALADLEATLELALASVKRVRAACIGAAALFTPPPSTPGGET